MEINMNFMIPLLKYRFTRIGQAIEFGILDYLGHKFYGGNRVDWEAHRRFAYKMYRRGRSIKEIMSRQRVPEYIVEWWVSIWKIYDAAWPPLKQIEPNDDYNIKVK